MNSTTVTNKMGHRGRHSIVLVAVTEPDHVVFQWDWGKDIPGLVQVLSKEYEKNGKWSANYWVLKHPENVKIITLTEDWETGQYINARTWQEAAKELNQKCKVEFSEYVWKAFIAGTFPDLTKVIMESEKVSLADFRPFLDDIKTAQAEIVAAMEELQAEIKLRKLEIEESRVRKQAADLKTALKNKKSMSLAELQALLNANVNGD